jgi:NAD+ synthase (glutamine-hydrolysing)
VYVTVSNLVGSEGGKIFPGASLLIGPKGEIRGRGPLWEEAVISGRVELDDSARARADTPLIADLEVMIPHLRASLDAVLAHKPVKVKYDPAPKATKAKKHAKARSEPNEKLNIVNANASRESPPTPLEIDAPMTADWLVHFLKEEMGRRGFTKAVIGISGGVDSAVTAYLAAKALGPSNVIGVRMPYKTSTKESLDHAQLVIEALGIQCRTIDISGAVDGYLQHEPEASPGRRGNVMARMRMITLFDLAAKHDAIPLGTGNKTERLFGYFTWHADDSPPVNPIGDLLKTQVLALAKHLGVPSVIVNKPPTADLVHGQTDEGDFGITYVKADEILNWILAGYAAADLVSYGFDSAEVELVRKRIDGTHWKRRMPTVAMISPTAIGESYLRPVDY